MNGRSDRILIPSAIALIAIGATLWLASGGTRSPTDWFYCLSGAELKFLVDAGIVTIGIGYLCNALFTLRMLKSETCRFVDFSKLMSAFGLGLQKPDNAASRKLIWQQLKEPLLDEFHLRLHSRAPKTLIDYCSRRNTGWYIAKTSGLASFIGWFVAVAIIFASRGCVFIASCIEIAGFLVSFLFFVIVIPWALCCQGTTWNREFWGVCWKWIYWDQQTHRPPQDWLKPLPDGVEWISESESKSDD